MLLELLGIVERSVATHVRCMLGRIIQVLKFHGERVVS